MKNSKTSIGKINRFDGFLQIEYNHESKHVFLYDRTHDIKFAIETVLEYQQDSTYCHYNAYKSDLDKLQAWYERGVSFSDGKRRFLVVSNLPNGYIVTVLKAWKNGKFRHSGLN